MILVVYCTYNKMATTVVTDPTVDISKLQEVTLSSYIPHPVCVTGIMLTSLKIDVGK